MRRIQVHVDGHIYRLARQKADDEGVSLSAVIRDALEQHLTGRRRQPLTLEDLGFVGVGRSDGGDLCPVSENHAEALARALEDEIFEKRPQEKRN